MVGCIVSVTDGSEMVKYVYNPAAGLSQEEVEVLLLSCYEEKDVWRRCVIESTIEKMVEELRRLRIPGYMMDDGQWYRCTIIENGYVLWEELI